MRTAPARRACSSRSRRCSRGTGRWLIRRRSVRRRSIARCSAGSAGEAGTWPECHGGEVPGVVGVGEPVDGRFQAAGGEGDQQVVQGGSAAQDEIAAVGIRGDEVPGPVGVQLHRVVVDPPAPGLGVVHRRRPQGPFDGDDQFCGPIHAVPPLRPMLPTLLARVSCGQRRWSRVTRRSAVPAPERPGCQRPSTRPVSRCRGIATVWPFRIVDQGSGMRSASSARRRGSMIS